MSTPSQGALGPGGATVRRRPEQLLLAFMGELMVAGGAGPLPASVLIAVLGELGVGEAATRAALTRMATRRLLASERVGRTVTYRLTPESERVLGEARDRVFDADPFAPRGTGWTLVTFSVPESRRDVRHRVRAQLAWAGFGLLRDGLWIAPGEVDVALALGGVHDDGRHDEQRHDEERHDSGAGDRGDDDELELLAFRAHEVPGFSAARSVRTAWRLDAMRARHEEFQHRWAGAAPDADRALCDLTALVADWLDLLRAVPRLPPEHLADDWPAARSVAAFGRLHTALAEPARAELGRRLAP
ncbi:MAG: PadR family transcriptional regulator [Cellulomonas sp.]|uniref:PaaX family transcriptional regulator n=1 Tax=Cellulomonas gelida TaxID=1712 RepID=A0A4Y3KPS2_9CELL|nr:MULTISPECIES: PaaX family transcriptional regulator C-terminal domain-containing protein [Cellulomonas]MCR6648826.1 PadR family transcriptional regulator [Cellulomonas sp.]GEA84878.1 PaaX family transcriptional regulator [Cellulomonas gelida]GGL37378.1 PaaX family transcriptional regulator [Cellulomonas gelida]